MQIYEYGDYIPNYSEQQAHVPHFWYDQSKSYNNNNNVFEALGVSLSLIIGEDEDDMWTNFEILDEIMRYLNLHIVQIGLDYYIFDWQSLGRRAITWLDVFSGDTITTSFITKTFSANEYASDDTQITMDDCFSQIKISCDVDEYDDIVTSPLDEKNLTSNYTGPQLYMREFCANGVGDDAADTFVTMIRNGWADANYGAKDESFAYIRDWYIQCMKSKNWTFKLWGADQFEQAQEEFMPGVYIDQSRPLRDFPYRLGMSGIIRWGKGIKWNIANFSKNRRIESFNNVLTISVNGNACDIDDGYYESLYNVTFYPEPGKVQFKNCDMEIRYNDSDGGTFSPNNNNITNYFVISGKLKLCPIIPKSGTTYRRPGMEPLDKFITWGMYQSFNKFEDALGITASKNIIYEPLGDGTNVEYDWWSGPHSQADRRPYLVRVSDQEDGGFYTTLFYKQQFVNGEPQPYDEESSLMPDIENDNLRMIKYETNSKSFFNANVPTAPVEFKTDVTSFVPIFQCVLRVGDKYCIDEFYYDDSSTNYGVKQMKPKYKWVTEAELPWYNDGGVMRQKNFFALGINPSPDDYIIGTNFDIYDNAPAWELGTGTKGTCIPITIDDGLSGDVEFKIIGIYNSQWRNSVNNQDMQNVIHKYITPWNGTDEKIYELGGTNRWIMPHVSTINISSFKIELKSDNGKVNIDINDGEIIYLSEKADGFINVNDSQEFKFNTAITGEMAHDMKVNTIGGKSSVVDMTLNILAKGLTNNLNNITVNAEQHYVDEYYYMTSDNKKIIETDVHNDNNLFLYNRYKFNWDSGDYIWYGDEWDVWADTKKMRVREISPINSSDVNTNIIIKNKNEQDI